MVGNSVVIPWQVISYNNWWVIGQVMGWIGLWTKALLAAGVLVILVYDPMCVAAWHEGMLLSNNEKLPKSKYGLCPHASSPPRVEFPPCCPPTMITSWNNNNWTLFISFIIIVIITQWCNQAQLLERVACGSHFGVLFRKTKKLIQAWSPSSYLLCNTTEVSYVLVNNFKSICDLLWLC